jgi:tetratricopeptide (TPR) repeat protein
VTADSEESLAAFERAIGLAPDDARNWRGKGEALYHLHRHEEALAAYEQLSEGRRTVLAKIRGSPVVGRGTRNDWMS